MGVYEGGEEKITINSDGSFNINGQYIPASDITKNGNTFSFKNPADGAEYSLTFKSDTEVEFKKNGEQIPLTKNPESGGGGSSGNDIDNQINALFDSIPNPTGLPATDLSELAGSTGTATYKGTATVSDLTIIGNYAELAGMTEEELREQAKKEVNNLYLTIANNLATFGEIISGSEGSEQQSPSFTDKQLLKDGSKYSADAEEIYNEEGVSSKNKYYIEFTKSGDDINITYIIVISMKGRMPTDQDSEGNPIDTDYKDVNYGIKIIYKGTLTKQAN